MIEVENIHEDLRTDEIGIAIRELRRLEIWNREKHACKEALFKKLTEHKYVKSASTRAHFRMIGGIGFSYLYRVPEKKRGRFANYRGQLLRLVYVASAKDYLEIRFGVVDRSQMGRTFISMSPQPIDAKFDPRRFYHLGAGEF